MSAQEAFNGLADIPPATSPMPKEASDKEVMRAHKLWLGGHHAFFYHTALLEYCYQAMRESWEANGDDRFLWGHRITLLWRSAGALMRFGIDFHPTPVIYEEYIRVAMPPSFSGLWLRERQMLHGQRSLFDEFAKQRVDEDLKTAKSEIAQAHKAYLEYHFSVMDLAAPGQISLAQDYRKKHGHVHVIGPEEADACDKKFMIERSGSLEWIDYASDCMQIFLNVVMDLQEGHRLSECILQDIANGMRTASDIFREPLTTT